MTLGTRSRIAIAAALLSSGALLAPAAPAAAGIPRQCTPDNCDTLVMYYSDATKTVRVGEYEGGPCNYIEWGEETQYVRFFTVTCF